MGAEYTDIVKERLATYMKDSRLKVTALEKKAGISAGSLRQSAKPSADFIRRVLEVCPDLSAEWLMRGQGNMLKREAAPQHAQQVTVSGDNNFDGAPAINNGTFSTSPQSDRSAEIALLRELLEEKDRALRDKERTIQILLGNLKRDC